MIDDITDEQRDKVVVNAGKLLHFLVTDLPNKARVAERRRAALRDDVNSGRKPSSYHKARLDFIYNVSSNVFGWLAQRSKEFDAENPHDMCTVNDLMDVLRMAQQKLHAEIKKNQKAQSEPPVPTSAS